MIFSYDNHITYLKDELRRRGETQPGYSMRTFARDLGISPSGLSQIMNRKRILSSKKAFELGRRLKLSVRESEFFSLLAEKDMSSDHSGELSKKIVEVSDLARRSNVKIDRFRLISDWFGMPIAEFLTEVPGRHTAAEVAVRFGITEQEAQSTIDRLIRLNLIEEKNGEFVRTHVHFIVDGKNKPQVTNHYFNSVLETIEPAIQLGSNERLITAEVIAFDPSQLNDVQALVEQFLDQLNDLASRGQNRTEVFQALTVFYPLTRPTSPCE